MIFQEKCFSCCILLTKQISLSDCLYFWRYWSICVLRLFFNQVLTSKILELTLSLLSIRFAIWPKSQVKKIKDLEFFIIFKGLSVVKNCLRPESTLLKSIEIEMILGPTNTKISNNHNLFSFNNLSVLLYKPLTFSEKN